MSASQQIPRFAFPSLIGPQLRCSARTTRSLLGLLALCVSAVACKNSPPADPPGFSHHLKPLGGNSPAVFTNGGFEDGTLGGWSVTTGKNPSSGFTYPAASTADLHLTAGGSNLSATVTGATETVLPAGLTSSSTLRIPKFGAYSAVVNQQGANYNSNSLTQTATMSSADVDTTDGNIHIRFAVAPVLQNPGHSFAQQPYYYVQVVNQTRGLTLASTLHYSNEPGIPWKTDPGAPGILYTDWQAFDISPGSTQLDIGDSVTVTVVATGCGRGGHWGEVYLDAFGSRIPGLSVQARAPNAVNAGSNLVYTYAVGNGGTAAGTNVTVNQPIPANLTFTSADVSGIPGATCTAPAPGATSGTISCNLGTLGPSASQNFTITFNVPATVAANTSIANGTYAVQGDGIAPLLGPVTNSTVTSGVVYADLAITGTDGKAAVLFGDPDVYTIVVENNGPTAVSGAPVSVPIPAQFTNASWTCAPATGSNCAATSGSGAISTTVDLPSGGQAVFTLSGNIIAGSGSSSLRMTGSIATPSGISDPFPANNSFSDTDSIGSLDIVTVTKSGNGTGRVVSSPAAIDCGSACGSASAKFLDGSQVSFTATPGANQLFSGWTSGCSGSANPCTITLAANVTVTASFLDLPPPTVTSVSPGQGVAGTVVTIAGSNFQVGATVFLNGTAVTVTAATATSLTFTVPTLSPGTYDVKVVNPDAKSATLASSFVYLAPTTVSLSSSAPTQTFAAAVTFTATVSGSGAPSGTVTFLDGGTSIGSGTLAGGNTSLTTSALAVGNHSITAQYNGDTTFNVSTSGVLTQTIVRATPAVALTVAPPSPVSGQPVDLSANVTGPGGTPSGDVSFFDAAVNIGTVTLASGAATLSLPSLSVGNHSITVQYAGDIDFSPQTSAATAVSVGQASTTTAFAASPSTQSFGAAVTLAATVAAVAPGSGTPDGNLTFFDGTASLGTVALSNGAASLVTSSLSVGSHTLVATYNGSNDFLSSTNSAGELIVKASASATVSFTPASPVRGQQVQLTATVTGPGATPSGSVTFLDGTVSLGTFSLSSGSVTLPTSALAVGNHSITVSYGGDGNFSMATSAAATFSVQQASTSVALTVAPIPSTFGANVSLQASVTAIAPGAGTPDGTVTFFDGTASLGTATLASGSGSIVVTTLAVGSHSLTATYAGSTDFISATSGATIETVNKATPAVLLTFSPASPVYGQTINFTATVSGPGATPSGSVTLSDGSTVLGTVILANGVAGFTSSSLAPGAHSLTADYGGDGNFVPATSSATAVTVQQASTATTLTASPQPSSFGGAVTLTAVVAPVSPGAGVPSGTVTFYDGTISLGTGSLSAGTATLSLSTLSVGPHSLTASYGGDFGFLTSTSPANVQTVNQAQSSVALAASPAATVYGQSLTLTATVAGPGATPSGSVTFLDGTTNIGSGALTSGVATLQLSNLAVGPHSLTASFSGDANFLPATSAAVPLTVAQAASSAALVVDINPSVAGQKITVQAGVTAVSPGAGIATGTLTFKDGTNTLGTAQLDSAGTATFSTTAFSVGTHPLTIIYAGDTNFIGSTSPVYSQIVGQAGTTLTLTFDPAAPVFGQPVHYTATVVVTSPGTGVATGSVTFTEGIAATGNTVLGTAHLDATGVVVFTDASLPPGSHTVTATYAGDSNFSGSSGSVAETVGPAATTTVLTLAPNPSSYGAAVLFTATVAAVAPGAGSPTGTVTFSDGTTAIGSAALSGGAASISLGNLLAGSHSITATFGGDANFNGSSTVAGTVLVVNRAATVAAITPSPSTSVTGQAIGFSLGVTSSGGVPTGQVSLYDGATTGTPIGTGTLTTGAAVVSSSFAHAGAHPLTVVYGGDANFQGNTSLATSYLVKPDPTAVTVAASPSQTLVNRPITFTARVTSMAPGSGTPQGSLSFADAGSSLGTVSLDAFGAASLTVSSMTLGNHPITASYADSADYLASQGTLPGGEVIQKSAPVAGSGSAVAFDGATQSAMVANADGALDGVQTVEVEFIRAASDVPHAAACLIQQGEGDATVFGLCLTARRDGIQVRRGADAREIPVDLGTGWHQVALIALGDSTLLLVDGTQVASLPGGFGTAKAQPIVFAAAKAGIGRTDRFAGSLDEIRFWSAPRAASDVQADQKRPVISAAATLLALWRMDEGAGDALYDAASQHAVATLEGTPSWVASEAWKSRTTPEERPLAAFTAGYDPDGAPITVTMTVAAPHGAATINADQIGYLPAQSFLGTDSFTYSVSNGQSSGNLFTTSVAVTHIDVCSAQSDCGGGDLCTNNLCVGPATLTAASGGCSSLPSSGPSTALLPLVLLAGFLLLRRRALLPAPSRTAVSAMQSGSALRNAALLLVLTCAAQARASDGFALDTFEPSPVGDHFFQVPDADVEGNLAPAFGLEAGWAHEPLTLYTNGSPLQQGKLVQNQYGLRLGGALPLFNRVLLDADIGMSAYQQGQTPFNGAASLSATAFHDPRLGARVALLRGDRLALAAGLSVFLPLGSQSGYGSDGSVRALPQLLASGRSGQVVYASEAGLELRKTSEASFTRVGSAVRLGLAGGWMFLNDHLQVGPELFSRVQLDDASRSSVEALLGARYQTGDFSFGLGAGGRLNQHAPGAAPVRVVAQLTFTGLDFLHSRNRNDRGQRLVATAPAPVQLAVVEPAPPVPVPAPVAPPPPAPAPVLAAADPDVKIIDGKIELQRTLRFSHDSATLDDQSKLELNELAEVLRNKTGPYRVFIAGHSDNHGTDSHNNRLTARRARAVQVELETHGVPSAKVKSQGCGSKAPVASNETDEGRALNRRVDILLPPPGVQPDCEHEGAGLQ